MCDVIRKNGSMCVNILRNEHAYISDAFSGRLAYTDQSPFDYGDWDISVTGAPMMSQALASLDCSIKDELHHGTHFVLVGKVESLKLNSPGAPLVYRARVYQSLDEVGSLSLEEVEYSWERYT